MMERSKGMLTPEFCRKEALKQKAKADKERNGTAFQYIIGYHEGRQDCWNLIARLLEESPLMDEEMAAEHFRDQGWREPA